MKLNENQRAILRYMARHKGADGIVCANWIAECCGHAYDTPWASSKLPRLAKLGLVKKLAPGWWEITPAGRAALDQGVEP